MTTPREDLVQSAVKFLGSDKVSAAPLDTQKKFLKGKSLTDEEIDEALARVKNVPPAIPPREEQIAMVENAQQLPEQQQWNRKDIVLASLAVVSAAYAGYTFVKAKIVPVLVEYGKSRDGIVQAHKDQVVKVNEQLTTLSAALDEVASKYGKQTSASFIDIAIAKHRAAESLETSEANYRNALELAQEAAAITDICNVFSPPFQTAREEIRHESDSVKAEIKVLKGLLLNRRNFPAPPPSSSTLRSSSAVADSPDSL